MDKAQVEVQIKTEIGELKLVAGGFWAWTKLNFGHSLAWFLIGSAVGGTVVKFLLKLIF